MATKDVVIHFIDIMKKLLPEQYQMARTKQFLSYVRLSNPEVNLFFREICQKENQADIDRILDDVVSGRRELVLPQNDGACASADGQAVAHERYCKN